MAENPGSGENERISAGILRGDEPGWRYGRRLFRMLPSSPRCKMCLSPFGAPFFPFMRAMGKSPWPKNPKYCSQCFRELLAHRGGSEVDCSLLFADVRGSTALAETMRPTDFTALMNRFFETASEVLVNHDAIVDKFVGDEVIGLFVPALTGAGMHARHAIEAGRELLRATGGSRPWLPIGIGVNSGISYVGTVGDGDNVDLTAMGDRVNVTARLAGAANAGEMLVTVDAAEAAELDRTGLERRRLDLKGKTEQTEVVVIRAD
jgi:adenylate cyclase